MPSKLTEVSNNRAFKGWQKVFSHESSELKCKMNFGVYLPHQAETTKLPVIYFLSGLTCTEANFIQKSGIQKYAADYGVIIVNPDTSPRGEGIPDDSEYDFGVGASFYVDAIQEPWKENFKMYTYITKELRGLINREFPVSTSQQSIMGHSMGGHGAIMIALKNPGMFKTVSAFAPICNPIECPWGKKAFGGYLGTDKDSMSLWKGYDSTCLAKKYNGPLLDILIDQGKKDSFIEQLMPDKLVAASKSNSSSSSSSSSKSSSKSTTKGLTVTLRNHDGYDHSYFFISTFIKDHIKHHIKYIKSKK